MTVQYAAWLIERYLDYIVGRNAARLDINMQI